MTESETPRRPRRFVVLLTGAGLLFAALCVVGFQGSRGLAAARARVEVLEARKLAMSQRVAELNGRIERLRHDPVTLERLAREDLGMVRPDDVVIVFPAAAH